MTLPNNAHFSTTSFQNFQREIEARLPSLPTLADEPVEDAITWIEENFHIPETEDHRLRLAPYQKRALSEALRRDENGNYVYSTVVWSDIKKSLKSCIAAARGLYAAYSTDWGSVYAIANDLKQADSRVAYYMRRAIELNPKMRAECRMNRYLIETPRNSRIEAIPVDPTGEAGGNADLLIFSELWGWKHDSHLRMWTEQTLSPTKFGKSQRWVETYAGFDGESPILQQLYETVVKDENRIDDDIELYAKDSILVLWNTKARLEWQTPQYYASEALILTPSEFDRVHGNKWARSTEAFVPMDWWDSCKATFPPLADTMVIALDAGVSSDLFAMVGVSRLSGITYPRYVNTWSPEENGKIDFEKPCAELERLLNVYRVVAVVYDPYQLHYFASLITARRRVNMLEFNQGTKRLEADKALYDAIREQRIGHDGNPLLREHVENANREAAGDNKLRIVKREAKKKIDALVALSMANHTAVELDLDSRAVVIMDAPDAISNWRG